MYAWSMIDYLFRRAELAIAESAALRKERQQLERERKVLRGELRLRVVCSAMKRAQLSAPLKADKTIWTEMDLPPAGEHVVAE
jgi:hypothetical protein